MLRTRLLTAAVALPAVLAAILFLPDWGFALFIVAVGLWGLYEVAEMTGPGSRWRLLECFFVGIVVGIFPFAVGASLAGAVLVAAISLPMLLMVADVNRYGAEGMATRWHELGFRFLRGSELDRNLAFLGAAYIGVVFPYFALVRNSADGIARLILMLLLVVCTDSGAYFVGRAVGRHKLAERVSPGKTIEGGLGGIVASILAGLILRPWLIPHWSLAATVIFAVIIAILAIVGDLMNSAFKRLAGVKDSGWIFPGHGGLLDRTCSLVLTAVLTYYYR